MMRRGNKQRGFSLIEVMIALIIMSMLGLMAWRGLDGLIRGKERIEGYSIEQRDLHYALTLLERDCNAMINGDNASTTPVAIGTHTVWWLRDGGRNNKPSWQLVGYRAGQSGLERLISSPFATRDAALDAWQGIAKAPDKASVNSESQHLSDAIVAQDVTILSGTPGLTTPTRALQVVWHLGSNDSSNTRPLVRICLAGGF